MSAVKFIDEVQQEDVASSSGFSKQQPKKLVKNLDLKLMDDTEQLMMQRKQRFDQLR